MKCSQIQRQIDDFSQQVALLRDRLSKESRIDAAVLSQKAEALYQSTVESREIILAKSAPELKKRMSSLILELDIIENEIIEKKDLKVRTHQIKSNSLISAYQS